MSDTGSWVGVGQGPSLSSVELVGSMLRVHFDESMNNNADFRDPTNYTITPTGGGDAVTVIGVTVGPGVNPTYVDLSLSNFMTAGSGYQLAVDSSLEDAAENAMDAGGLTLAFLGLAPAVTALDDQGIIQALTGGVGELQNEINGLRMTRLSAAVDAGEVTLPVESALDWAASGEAVVDGVRYTYSSRTDTSLTGIAHVAGGSVVSGTVIRHRDKSTVVDLSKEYSAMDLLRKGLLVNYAESEELNALGRNLGVDRLPLFQNDDQFREVVKALAYNPRGTILGITLALEGLVGAGNFEVYEDLIQEPNKVYIRIAGDSLISDTELGKTFLMGPQWDELAGTQDEVVLAQEPLAVGSVRLKSLEELFDFTDDIPSDVDMEPWPGETAINPWTYQGGESEGSAVTQVSGSHTELASSTGTVYYRMTDANGARIDELTNAEVSVVIRIPSTATLGANRNQCSVAIHDGAREIKWGMLDAGGGFLTIGLFNASGWLGNTVNVADDTFHEVTLKKVEDDEVELWVNGILIETDDHANFDASANHKVEFGILVTQAGMDAHYKYLGAEWSTLTDYWAARGAAGSVATANPTRFTDGASLLAAGDVGKRITIDGGSVSNGINNGVFEVASFVSSGVVEVQGPTREEGADITNIDAGNARIVITDEEFVFPDDIGKDIVISGSTLGNDGTYVIAKLLNPGDLTDLATLDSGTQVEVRTNVCQVASGLATESDVDFRVDPNFETESNLEWELSDAGSFSGTTVTLRQGLWVNGLVMETWASDVKSSQLLKDNDVENTVGAGPTYEYYPFYLTDALGLLQVYLDDLTAAGVIPVYETI